MFGKIIPVFLFTTRKGAIWLSAAISGKVIVWIDRGATISDHSGLVLALTVVETIFVSVDDEDPSCVVRFYGYDLFHTKAFWAISATSNQRGHNHQ